MSGDTFLYIYSKYSSSCNEILPIVHQIAPSTGLIAIDADNMKMRNYLLSLKFSFLISIIAFTLCIIFLVVNNIKKIQNNYHNTFKKIK